jgi:hypothetical protein
MNTGNDVALEGSGKDENIKNTLSFKGTGLKT